MKNKNQNKTNKKKPRRWRIVLVVLGIFSIWQVGAGFSYRANASQIYISGVSSSFTNSETLIAVEGKTLDFSALEENPQTNTPTSTPLTQITAAPTYKKILLSGYVHEPASSEAPATSHLPNSLIALAYAEELSLGAPLYGVTVSLWKENVEVVSTSTNYYGYFHMFINQDGSYLLRVTKGNHIPIHATIHTTSTDNLLANFVMKQGSEAAEPEDQTSNITLEKDTILPSFPTPNYNTVDTHFGISMNLKTRPLGTYLSFIISWLYLFSASVTIINLIFAGYRIIASGGNAEHAIKARQHLTTTLTALVLIITAWLVTGYIGGVSVIQWTL